MMTAKDIKTTRLIEDWANNEVKLHRRICKDSGCAGRAKIWWITRHPVTHPDIANKTAVDYVVSRQACEVLETRLYGEPGLGEVKFTWLPGEKEIYESRTVEEKAQLLGRAFLPAETSESTESTSVEVTSLRSPEREFLEVSGRKKTAPHTERIRGSRSTRVAVDETSESVDWVDALTRRRN